MGELQGALGNLRTIVGVVSPVMLGQLYAWGVAAGSPGRFYLVSAAAQAAALTLNLGLRESTAGTGKAAGGREEKELDEAVALPTTTSAVVRSIK